MHKGNKTFIAVISVISYLHINNPFKFYINKSIISLLSERLDVSCNYGLNNAVYSTHLNKYQNPYFHGGAKKTIQLGIGIEMEGLRSL